MATFQLWQVISGSHYQHRTAYRMGSKFVSDRDMTKFNTLPHAPKYKLIRAATEEEINDYNARKEAAKTDGEVPPVQSPVVMSSVESPSEPESGESPTDSLEAMTVQELIELAKDEHIDISGTAKKKSEIIARIREARAE